MNTNVTLGKSNKIKQKLAVVALCSSLTYSKCVSGSCHCCATMETETHYKVKASTRPSLVWQELEFLRTTAYYENLRSKPVAKAACCSSLMMERACPAIY